MEQEFLCQAFCPQLAITWVNFHASEVNAAVLSRLYRCVASQWKLGSLEGGSVT